MTINGFVIIRADGQYVAHMPTFEHPSSYTSRLERAKIYPTREEARRELCPESEGIVSLRSCLQGTE